MFHFDMNDLLFIIGLPFRAMPNQKMEAALSVQQKDKMADRSGCYQTSDFLRKRGGSFQIQFMVGLEN